eukprot:gene8069-8723_t
MFVDKIRGISFILVLSGPTSTRHSASVEYRWFSGKIPACHAGAPGSIPGRCRTIA